MCIDTPNREKAINGLETCEISGTREDCEGYGCPYFIYNNEVSDECQAHLFDDAIALLKSQPLPRVMTLEEVEDALDSVVWVDRPTAKNESKLFGHIQAYSRKFKYVQIKHIDTNMGEHMLYPYETYGKEWRCWTSRPTDEQRKVTPWPD